MTADWNKNFRTKSDEELYNIIESVDTTNYGNESTIRENIKIMAVQGELNRRNSEKQAKSSTRGMRASLFLAAVSLAISIYLGFTSNQSSQQWQTKQLPQLEAINRNTKHVSDFYSYKKTKGINNDRK